jgi:hypothetical protein
MTSILLPIVVGVADVSFCGSDCTGVILRNKAGACGDRKTPAVVRGNTTFALPDYHDRRVPHKPDLQPSGGRTMLQTLPKATIKIFDGKVYVEVSPDRDTPPRLKPDGKGGWRRVGWARNFKLASHVWGLRSAAPALPSQPRTSPMRARALRPRERRSAPRRDCGGDGSSASGDDGGSSDPPPPHPKSEHDPRAEVESSSRAPRVLDGRAQQ